MTNASSSRHPTGPGPVGRDAELAFFQGWLAASAERPSVLVVTGPPGIGKTTLLHAFEQLARSAGWYVLDVQSIKARSGEAHTPAPDRGHAPPTLVVLDEDDGCPPTEPERPEEIEGRLGPNDRLVIATSRRWPRHLSDHPAWGRLEVIELESLAAEAARDCLAAWQVSGSETVADVVRAVGGHPLGLILTGELVRRDRRPPSECPGWPRLRHRLIRNWLRGMEDAGLRTLMDAAAVVHCVDQDLLQIMLARRVADDEFDRLLQSGVVRTLGGRSGHGLALHPDLRRLLEADLRWRRPDRHALFRQRALNVYRARMRRATPPEREPLAVDCLHLSGDVLVHDLLFSWEAPQRVRVRPGGPQCHADVQRLWAGWVTRTFGIDPLPPDEAEELGRLLAYAGTRLRVAEDTAGHACGFTAILPVCAESIALLKGSQVAATLIEACWSRAELSSLPASHEGTHIFMMHHMAWSERDAEATVAALLQDAVGVLAYDGVYLASVAHPGLQRLLESLGFRRVEASVNPSHDPVHPVVGYELDLSAGGFVSWLQDLCSGRRPAGVPRGGELVRDLQDVLARWHDDTWLANSRAARWPVVAHVQPVGRRAEAVRRLVAAALEQARAEAGVDAIRALEVLDRAYLGGRRSHRTVAKELAVSRATFYRLLRRGVDLLADHVGRAMRRTAES